MIIIEEILGLIPDQTQTKEIFSNGRELLREY